MKVGVNCKLPNKDMKEIKSKMQSLLHRSVALNISHLNTKIYLRQHIATAKYYNGPLKQIQKLKVCLTWYLPQCLFKMFI